MHRPRIEILDNSKYSEWNSFVDRSPQGDVFCYTWWLDAITKSNFKIITVIEGDEIVAGMPLTYNSDNKVDEPPLTRTLGVLFKSNICLSYNKQYSNQRKWAQALIGQVPLNDFIQISAHHNFTDWLPFRWKGFKQTTKYTYLINYSHNSINDLYKNLSRGRKDSIKRAVKNDIKIEQTNNFELLYKFVSLTFNRQGIDYKTPFTDLKRLDDAILKYGNRIIFQAVDNDKNVHAMIYVVYSSRSAYYLLSGSDPEYRKKGGHTLIFWETIKYFSDKVEFSNFGGSNIKNIEEHLRGFGGTLTPYFHIYNEKLMWKNTGIRYHLKEISFHSGEILKSLKNKLL